MSVRKRRLIVNLKKFEICVLNPERPKENWKCLRPTSIFLIRRIPKEELFKVLFSQDYEKDMELILEISRIDNEHWRFWECIVTENNISRKVWITPTSLIHLLFD